MSQAELIQLKAAVDRHGRDWFAVSHDVGSKTKRQCFHRLITGSHREAPGQPALEGCVLRMTQPELLQGLKEPTRL